MIFTKEIENTPKEIVLSMEDAELALMDAEFDLAMEDFNMYRANYDAEILAIEAYVKADKNLELCTESFNVIKEGFVDKVKKIGNAVWAAIKKMFRALAEKAKAFKKQLASIKLPSVINKTVFKNAYNIDDLEKRVTYVCDFLKTVGEGNYKLIQKISDTDDDKDIAEDIKDLIDRGGGEWVYKLLLKYLHVKPPFGSNDYNKSAELIEALKRYLESARQDTTTISNPTNYIKNVISRCERMIDSLNKIINRTSSILNDTEKAFEVSEAFYNKSLLDMIMIGFRMGHYIINTMISKIEEAIASWSRFGQPAEEK